MAVTVLHVPESLDRPPGMRQGSGFCGADPLVAVPHTSVCMGVDSFTERTGGPHVMWAYISL